MIKCHRRHNSGTFLPPFLRWTSPLGVILLLAIAQWSIPPAISIHQQAQWNAPWPMIGNLIDSFYGDMLRRPIDWCSIA